VKRLRLLFVALALVVLAAGCKVDTTVSIRVRDDGSGVVQVTAVLDAEAVQSAEAGGGKLEDRVRLSDLGGAGWKVSPWTREPDGSARLQLSKPFNTPAEVHDIVAEISGTVGPLRDVTVTRDRGLVSTSYGVRGTLDLADIGTGIASDADLVARLTNQKVDVRALDQALLAQLRKSVGVRVWVQLPGQSASETIGRAGKQVPVAASASVLDTKRIALGGAAVLLVVLALLVLLWPGGRRRPRAERMQLRHGR
jgi:hypothetical protein